MSYNILTPGRFKILDQSSIFVCYVHLQIARSLFDILGSPLKRERRLVFSRLSIMLLRLLSFVVREVLGGPLSPSSLIADISLIAHLISRALGRIARDRLPGRIPEAMRGPSPPPHSPPWCHDTTIDQLQGNLISHRW